MRTKIAALGLAAVTGLAVAGCSNGPTAHVTGSSTTAPVTGSSSVNKLVCQHYLRQYAWKQHLTFPSLADAVKWAGYVAGDSAEAAPGTKLARDLNSEVAAMQAALKGKKATYKNGTVYRDCTSGQV